MLLQAAAEVADEAQIWCCCTVAPVRPQAWELPYATGAVVQKKKQRKERKKPLQNSVTFLKVYCSFTKMLCKPKHCSFELLITEHSDSHVHKLLFVFLLLVGLVSLIHRAPAREAKLCGGKRIFSSSRTPLVYYFLRHFVIREMKVQTV